MALEGLNIDSQISPETLSGDTLYLENQYSVYRCLTKGTAVHTLTVYKSIATSNEKVTPYKYNRGLHTMLDTKDILALTVRQ